MTYQWERMQEDMQLKGLAPKTQACYLRVVRRLAEYCQKSPGEIDDILNNLLKIIFITPIIHTNIQNQHNHLKQ